jgi:hypothetical protein
MDCHNGLIASQSHFAAVQLEERDQVFRPTVLATFKLDEIRGPHGIALDRQHLQLKHFNLFHQRRSSVVDPNC